MLVPGAGAPAGTTTEALMTVGDVVDGFPSRPSRTGSPYRPTAKDR